MKNFMPIFRLFSLLLTALAPATAAAQASDWQGIDKAQVRLVSSLSTTNGQADHLYGLEFQMEKGWKVYWRSPGDAGYPPALTWNDTPNLDHAALRWPRPSEFEVLGLQTLGYKDHVIFPVDVALKDPAEPFNGTLNVRFLTCDEICIPVEVNLGFDTPSGQDGTLTAHAQDINKYVSLVPHAAQDRGVELTYTSIAPAADGKKADVTFHVQAPWAWQNPTVYVEGPLELVFSTPTLQRNGDSTILGIRSTAEGLHYLDQSPADIPFSLTILDGDTAIEAAAFTLQSNAPEPSTTLRPFASPETAGLSRWVVLGFALLGGFILNFMPCVLPVLSLKVFGLIHHAHEPVARARKRFLATSIGIIASFLILAAVLFGLQSGGVAIGWGIQFQQPLFLLALAVITSLFACNMWGFFEIQLPSKLNALGHEAGQSKGYGGDFLTGAFATLLATPCSAPFLGTAIGFAFTQGPLDLFLIFAALGVGLALPYLLLALYPQAGRWLPKPGPWMVYLKSFLGLLLLGTALWLLSVLFNQIGTTATFVAAAGLSIMILAFALRNTLKGGKKLVVSLSILSTLALPLFFQSAPQASADYALSEEIWQPYSDADIQKRVQAGEVIFVDVTADWCITCQVNKRLVTYNGDVFDALENGEVTAMKADWTNPDPAISKFLARYNRYAIPFNIVYGPEAPEGIILPEILTQESVIDAFSKAKG